MSLADLFYDLSSRLPPLDPTGGILSMEPALPFTMIPATMLLLFTSVISPLLTPKGATRPFLDAYVCQRIVRALMAVVMMVLAGESLLTESYTDSFTTVTESSQYILSAFVWFYIYDTMVLFATKSTDITMYAHHLAALFCFGVALITGHTHWHLLYVILYEILVPFGCLLFLYKYIGTPRYLGSYAFLAICVSGMLALVAMRMPMTCYLIYEYCSKYNEWGVLYTVEKINFFVGVALNLTLDSIWAKLYWRNIQKWDSVRRNILAEESALKAPRIRPKESGRLRKRETSDEGEGYDSTIRREYSPALDGTTLRPTRLPRHAGNARRAIIDEGLRDGVVTEKP